MKAIVQTGYGGPEVLRYMDVDKPSPGPHELLIRVHATAVNDYDWCMMRGKPYLYRLMYGLFKPKTTILGMELSGTVEALGEKVSGFAVGDAIYGDISNSGFGSFADYVCVNEQAVVAKPQTVNFIDAAAIPHAACLAAQGLIDIGNISKHQKILVNGAGGGVGCYALAIAKTFAAEVTGVDSGDKLARMKSIGFDHVIDYKQQDFTRGGRRYDLILDTKSSRSPLDIIQCLSAQGKYVTVGGDISRLLQTLCLKPWISKIHGKTVAIVSLKSNKDLDYINELFAAGKLRPVIDGPYPLSKAAELIQYFGEAKHTGKIVLTPDSWRPEQ